MNENIILVVDSASSLPLDFIKNKNVIGLGVNCIYNNTEIVDDFGENFDINSFYNALENGVNTKTSQINSFVFEELFTPLVKEKKSIIYIGLSSGLSGTINNAMIAVHNLKEKFDEVNIHVIDSKSVSLGEGILAYLTYEMIKDNKELEEILEFINDLKDRIYGYFTVNDLKYLKQGGRISTTKALVGSMLGIKPIIYVDKEGKLELKDKARGTKKAISYLLSEFKDKCLEDEVIVGITYGKNEKDKDYLVSEIQKFDNVKTIITNNEGPVISTHSGPELISLFFVGKNKK